MSAKRKVLLGVVGWLAGVTLLHLWLNTHLLEFGVDKPPRDAKRFRVGFIPVT